MKKVLFAAIALLLSLVSCEEQEILVSSISLNEVSLEMVEGTTFQLTATVKPDNATEKTILWKSSDESVVTVKQGLVSALKPGSATITATAGNSSALCRITVKSAFVPVESVTLDKAELNLVEGDEGTLTATVNPENATDKTVTWVSSDPEVATVEGGKVSALKAGTATITAKAGEKEATCALTVQKRYIPVESISLDKTDLTLVKGTSEDLTATVSPDNATEPDVTWTSSNPDIAKVEGGKVTAVNGGSATITAKAGEKEATCEVTVTVPVESVTLDQTELTLVEEQQATLTATVNPADATDKTVSWSSSDPEVASVEGGKVSALKAGTATITAKAGEKEATCKVTVQKKYVPVESVTLDQTELALTKGNSATLKATVNPADATEPALTWTSSNADVATVDETGKVTATGGGTATITAKAGEKQATCTVTVTVPVESVTLDQTSATVEVNQSFTLKATVNPADATDKTVSWSSSHASVATVDQEGKVQTLKIGTAIITAKAGGKEATCTVTVKTKVIPVESVTLDQTSLEMNKGASVTLVATVNPSNATDKTVTWSSSNANVASVDSEGKVTAVSAGSATITANASGKEATCAVTVVVPVTGIELNATELSINKGERFIFYATLIPDDATDRTVSWFSENAKIAYIDGNGYMKGVGGGQTVIHAVSGDASATCTVMVNAPLESLDISQDSLTLEEGKSATLKAILNPTDATGVTITWTSSSPDVASVDDNGLVTGITQGTAVITLKANEFEKTCAVTVTEKTSNTDDFGGKDGEWD